MFKVFKLPKMIEREVQTVIQDQFLCRIAFQGKEHPYIAPFQYIYTDNSLYFHFTNYGKKMMLLERDNRVCVEIEKYSADFSEYSFVALRGTLEVVTDSKERKSVIKKMSQEGKRRLSTNLLFAHGFNPDEGWSVFSHEVSMVIVKLGNVKQIIGLKSP